MDVFSSNGRSVDTWGPATDVSVRFSALGGVVGDSWILTNLSINAREITDVRQCFEDVSFIYALGNDQNQCRIVLTFAIFIGARNCTGSNNTATIGSGLDGYTSSRISNRLAPTSITIGNFSCMGYLVGVDIGNLDALRGICYGTVTCIMEL